MSPRAWPGSQGGTYGGNAVACAAAIATLDVIQAENLVENARVVGGILASGLDKVAADNPAVGDVRGLGLMLASEFVTRDGEPDPASAQGAQQQAAQHRALHQRLCPAKEALAILQTLAARIQAPIDDMNGHVCIRLRLNRPRGGETRSGR